MRTIVVRITGDPEAGDIVCLGYRAPKGGETAARHDAVAGDTAATVADELRKQIGVMWLKDDAFHVRAKAPSSLVITCTERVSDVAFFSMVKKAEGSLGPSVDIAIEEI